MTKPAELSDKLAEARRHLKRLNLEAFMAGERVVLNMAAVSALSAAIADPVCLTTVRQPLEDKWRTAAKILLDLIADPPRRRSIEATELIVRATTGPAAD